MDVVLSHISGFSPVLPNPIRTSPLVISKLYRILPEDLACSRSGFPLALQASRSLYCLRSLVITAAASTCSRATTTDEGSRDTAYGVTANPTNKAARCRPDGTARGQAGGIRGHRD